MSGVVDPVYNLSERFSTDTSTESKSWLRVYEDSNGGGQMTNEPLQRTLLFRVTDTDHWLCMSRSYIMFRVKMSLPLVGGNPVPVTQPQAFINGFHKAFRRCNLRANGQTVDVNHNYLRDALNIKELLSSNIDFDLANGSRYGYISEASRFGVDSGNTGVHDVATNPSFNARQGGAAGAAEIVFSVPLHKFFPFLAHYDKVLTGISWEVELELAPDAEYICTAVGQGGAEAPRLAWSGSGAVLFVDRRMPALDVRTNLAEMLQAGFQLNGYEYLAHSVHRKSYSGANASSEDYHVTAGVSKPVRIYVMFQNTARLTDRELNVLDYDKCNISRLSVSVNGSPNPLEAYTLDWQNGTTEDRRGDRMRAYNDLLATRGMDVSPMSDKLTQGTINYFDWSSRNLIYAIDLNSVNDTEFSGASEINIHFERTTNAEDFNCIVVIEHVKVANIAMSSTDSQIVVS